MNLNADSRDNINSFLKRMSPWKYSPSVYGTYVKISSNLNDKRFDVGSQLDNIVTTLRGVGCILVLSCDPWEGFANVSDASISKFADKMAEINSYGIPVFIRPAHEMNGPWYIYGQQPSAYIDFHRKIVKAVRAKTKYSQFKQLVFAPNIGIGYPWASGSYKYLISKDSPDFKIVDTNNDGVLTEADDPYTPYYPGDEY
ncbi:hypothetical protein HK096_004679, partial [Nowakowskiella sp. JEL0078]